MQATRARTSSTRLTPLEPSRRLETSQTRHRHERRHTGHHTATPYALRNAAISRSLQDIREGRHAAAFGSLLVVWTQALLVKVVADTQQGEPAVESEIGDAAVGVAKS